MSKLKVRIEGDEFDDLLRSLVDMAIELDPKDAHVVLRILQILLYGEWEEE